MPSTVQNVSNIEAALKGRFSRPQILSKLSELQTVVYSQRTEETKKIDPATGNPPYLVTSAGTLQYNCPSDCWMTDAIYAESPIKKFSSDFDHGENRSYYFKNREYERIPISQTIATVGSVATVTFTEDPGATTTKFFHSYWIKANDLESESDELSLPEHTHYIVRLAVVQMLNSEEYGDLKAMIEMMELAAQRIRRELNRGARGRIGKTQIQPEYRDWNYGGYGYYS